MVFKIKLLYCYIAKLLKINLTIQQFNNLTIKRGFTLVEFLVGFGLVGIISVLVAALYFTNFRLFSNQNASIDINSQNKIAIDEITNQLRQSQAVASSCCGGDASGVNALVLQLWPLDVNGDPTDPNPNYDYIVYKIDPTDPTRIQKKTVPAAGSTRPASTKVLSTDLAANGLSFTYAPDNASPQTAEKITVSITTTKTANGKTQTVTQTGNGTLRNK